MNIKKIKSFDSELGSLIPIEFNNLEWFNPKRVFFVKDVPIGTIRGNHAHYTTQQILFCIQGSIEVILFDGYNEETTVINKNEYVFVDKMIWDAQKFMVKDTILFVIASTSYNIDDYIFDKEEFIKIKLKNDK